MLRIEQEEDEDRFRVWSDENNRYMLRQSTIPAVMDYYRKVAVIRADYAASQFIADARQVGCQPLRQPDVLS